MPVFALIMKIVACAVGLYVAAAFLVSLRRLLPFFTLGTSIATLVSITRLANHADARSLVWIPIALSIATMLFYGGEGFMSPNIVENAYRVVSVERRWTSLFADDDDYVVHVAPVEIGGFFENVFFSGLFFWFFYAIFLLEGGNVGIAYIPAIYFLGMSVVEILLVIGQRVGLFHDFPTLLYWLARLAVIVLALVIGFTGGPAALFNLGLGKGGRADKSAKALYEQCVDLVKLDYSHSYQLTTDYRALGADDTPTLFMYDADRDTGGYFRYTEQSVDFYKVYTTDPRLGAPARFLKQNDSQFYYFDSFVTKLANHPLPFESDSFSAYENYDIPSLCTLTLHKVANATQIKQDDEEQRLQILYATRNDTSMEHPVDYQVAFYFNTAKKDGTPYSLYSIACDIYVGSYQFNFSYRPLNSGTEIDELFVFGERTLKDYKPGDEVNNYYEIVRHVALQGLEDLKSNPGKYDFILYVDVDDRYNNKLDEAFYVYDGQTQVALKYSNDSKGGYAASTNHYVDDPPDQLVANRTGAVYTDSATPTYPGDAFEPFTGDDAVVSQAILHAFNGEVYFWGDHDVSVESESAFVTMHIDDYTIDEVYSCTAYYASLVVQDDTFYLSSITVPFFYYELEGSMTVKRWSFNLILSFSDLYQIPDPSN